MNKELLLEVGAVTAPRCAIGDLGWCADFDEAPRVIIANLPAQTRR